MTLHGDARQVLSAYAGQPGLRDEFIEFVDAHPDAMWRKCRDGHVTASALVVDPASGRVLLTLHPKVGRWLQLGGHCEPSDPGLRAAALREATEESGIAGLEVSQGPLRLDRHGLFCRPGVWLDHLDVQYLAIAPESAVAIRSPESVELEWFDWHRLPAATDDSVRALVAAGIDAIG